MKNYYEILEVNQNASGEVIEKAYHVLTKKYHPDLYSGDERFLAEEKMRDINEAYKILSDGFLKEQYDVELQKENLKNSIQKNNKYQFQNTVNVAQQKDKKIHKVGTLMSLVDVSKEVLKNVPKKREKQELGKDDIKAGIITAVIVVIILLILWFIPFTRGFLRSLIPF